MAATQSDAIRVSALNLEFSRQAAPGISQPSRYLDQPATLATQSSESHDTTARRCVEQRLSTRGTISNRVFHRR